MNFKNVGEIIKFVRTTNKLSREEFGELFNKHRNWVYLKETNKSKIYITDLILIAKKFNIDILFKSDIYEIKLYLMDHTPNNLLRFIRESTSKTQKEFAKDIGKTNDWSYTNEAGTSNYYANDLFELANINKFDIEVLSKK